jgi:hypothetical protein
MNVRICKQKCKNAKQHGFCLGFNFNTKKPTIYFNADGKAACLFTYLKEDIDYRKILGKHPSYIARFMKVTKECPYYMEHELFDWNRK